jgi:hypothetical protein
MQTKIKHRMNKHFQKIMKAQDRRSLTSEFNEMRQANLKKVGSFIDQHDDAISKTQIVDKRMILRQSQAARV